MSNFIQKSLIKTGIVLRKKSPIILTCLGGLGAITTVVLAVKATPKAMELIKEDSKKNHDGDENAYTSLEAVKSSWKCYVTPVLVGSASLICIFGANALNVKNQASLASAYALLDQTYKKYRVAANKVFGDDADSKIKTEIAKETYVSDGWCYIYRPDLDKSEVVTFFDDYSLRYFETTMAAVINAQYHINRNLALGGVVSMNEFYEFLGLESIAGGDDVGWYMQEILEGGFSWLDFTNELIKMDGGFECYRVSAVLDPIRFDDIEDY